ncbi:unnamed protein product [Adineta ricciae]|uniref:G-protein coupled receptors family 3 profile domain-containing protein n=1 Tax=Adineta ricciae TaxID=249248 RepID=A0A814JFY1_ADIRI|nr:unnamed protein product [Adineta ricciae]CAF1038789.1 unnamed protein product [Adineta ricciae]
MRQKKSEQQHYHSRDDYDHISSTSSSSSSATAVVKSTELSSYIQLQHKHSHMLTMPKLKQSWLDFRRIRSYLILFLLSSFLVLSFTFFIRYPKQKQTDFDLNHRVKRQLITNHIDTNDARHYTKMLRRMLSNGVSSSVLADCTINMASDGIYYLPSSKTLSSETINLVERTFHSALREVKSTASQIRQELNLSSNGLGDFALAKFQDDYRNTIRYLLYSQRSVKEINIMVAKPPSNENGGAYIYYDTVKYYRSENDSSANDAGLHSIREIQLKQNLNTILQTFTAANARETLKQANDNSNNTLFHDGWWIGPVLCEKNKNETFLMAHIFPLTISYFFVTYFNISSVDINQCAADDVPFGGTHKCSTGMECIFRSGQGFTLGAYTCRCSNSEENTTITIDGNGLEWNETSDNGSLTSKLNSCKCNPHLCGLTHNKFLRTIVIIIQSIFIVFVAILAAIIFQKRKTKIIKYSMWILLELILLGAVLLYASVIVDSFGPHGIVCLVIPWLRELGFTIVYGTLILRIYKMLAEFQSRKAHCVQVKEKDILRILSFFSISIIGYLLGWTLVNIDHANENISLGKYLLGNGHTLKDKAFFQTCRPRTWDYLIQFAEFVFLCIGIRFIYSTRTAPCEYHERKLITIVIVCEMLFSTLLHIIKDCLWSSVTPDALFILSVFRCHFTVTCMLILIFCTKLCYIYRPFNEEFVGRDRFRSVADGGEPADLFTKLHSNGDVEFGELNIRDMDPEEIRVELKRLYTSLHVLKTKTMRKDNPHLTKRHGQRRKNRRFSMQAFQRHGASTTGTSGNSSGGGGGGCGHLTSILAGGEKHDHDPLKTPEDSTGSHNEHAHLGGISMHRGSVDESDDAHGRTLSDLTTTMATTGVGQRVTFK